MMGLEFAGQAHVQPLAALGDDLFGLLPISTQSSIGSFSSVLKSSLPRRINEPSVSIVTVALRLASEISASSPKVSPTSQFGQADAFLVERRLAGDDATAAGDDVEKVAVVALFDDDVAGFVVHLLHAHEDGLDIGRRNLVERLGLQQGRHPVVATVRCRPCSSLTS